MMNDKPNVLKLNVNEWKALTLQRIARLGDGISQIGEHLQKQQAVTPQMLMELDQFWAMTLVQMETQWADVKLPLKGWEQISRPLVAEYQEQQVREHKMAEQPAQQSQPYVPSPENITKMALGEAVPPKRKGGWVKGRPRKPKANATSVPVTQ